MRNCAPAIIRTWRKPRILALLLFAVALTAMPLWAQGARGTAEINWFSLLMGLFGGLAMFLFGLDQLSEGLKSVAGDSLKDLLAKLTKNRFMGAFSGAVITALLNSSSVTTVLVVGFISAGLMTLSQSVAVIMGANVGSTVTAQIVAFNITQYALIPVALGFFTTFTARQDSTRYYGAMLMGLGLIFYGMGVMGEAMTPLRSYQPFLDLMVKMESPLLGILVGAVFTGLVQSSAATTGIAIVMASEGLISLPAGIALAFGSNIGTCVTALLAAIGKPVEAVRAAVVHILFNIAGVLLWIMFIPQLADIVVALSPTAPELSGKARMAAEVPRQIANAHTLFNVANTLIFIWFTNAFARIALKLVPDKAEPEKVIVKVKYLDDDLLEVPSLALERVRLELGHMGDIIGEMLEGMDTAFKQRSLEKIRTVRKMDDKVDVLQVAILHYLGRLRGEPLTEKQSVEFQVLMAATFNLENLADVIESELAIIGEAFIEQNIVTTDAATAVLLDDLTRTLVSAIDNLNLAVRDNDEVAAVNVISVSHDVRRLCDEFLSLQSQRIAGERGGEVELVRLEMELLDKLRRIYTLAKRVAKTIVPEEVAASAS